MIKFEINQAHLKAIKDKLAKLSANAKPGGEITLVLRKVIGDYQVTILQGIGTVEAVSGGGDGAPVAGNLNLTYRGSAQSVTWTKLRESTLDLKYPEISFWLNTGTTRDAITDSSTFLKEISDGKTSTFLAGLTPGTEAYTNAWRTETGGGGEFAPRPLFSHANELFKQHQPEIMEKVRKALMKNVNWGA